MKNKFSDVFKKLRIKNKYTQEDIANKFDMTKTGISYWENGKSEPSLEVIEKLAELFNVSIDYLLGNSNTENDYGIMHNRTNVIGVVPAGVPLEAIEDIIGEIEYPSRFEDKEVFALQIKGDSMNKVLPDGSIGLFEKTDVLENGQIGAILVNGYDATVKKFYRLTDSYVLEPLSFNPDYQPIVIKDGTDPVSIVGKLLWYCSKESLM
ncbi:XRE family transcriptional regulator [Solobacterium moorei]|uniref:LexA family protein n=1 Tax=Solobacterium moorei TaxID=102148 RepID=UPI0023F24DF0|nr:XRE family transcriptional regulator [Solobacterium moorei]